MLKKIILRKHKPHFLFFSKLILVGALLFGAVFLAQIGFFKLRLAHAAGTTFYIAANGSDSNNGTSESTPWAHLPGMVGCTGSCASYIPKPGDQFILRGGDTWGASSLGVIWTWSGTAASPIYIGVNKTWYSGSSWARPIFSCGGVPCSGTGNAENYIFVVGSYVTIDNIEFTGLAENNSGAQYVSTQLDHDIVENSYFHGWVLDGQTSDSDCATSFDSNNFSPIPRSVAAFFTA